MPSPYLGTLQSDTDQASKPRNGRCLPPIPPVDLRPFARDAKNGPKDNASRSAVFQERTE